MPLYPLNREQSWLLPPTLNDLIPGDHPARFVAEFVDALDRMVWAEMGIDLEGNPLGAPAYHPRALLSVWLYGFMTGTRTSRKLEIACRDQMPYLWLTGWEYPDHNTLWRFYKEHRAFMRGLFKRTVRTAVNMGLVDMAVQAIDGTKIAGNASKDRTYDAAQLQRLLEKTETAIKDLEAQNETGAEPPPVHLPKELADKQRLRVQVKAAMEGLAEEDKKRVNLTDSDTGLLKASRRQGMVAGYNLEAAVSHTKVSEAGKRNLVITAVDVGPQQSDINELVPMLEQSEGNMETRTDMSLADAGFHSGPNLEACEQRRQVVVMPEPQEKALENPFHKDHFVYDCNSDSYVCPHGQTLKFNRMKYTRSTLMRQYCASGTTCRGCPAFGNCTKDHRGRRLEIGPHEAQLRRHRQWMATQEAKDAYRQRMILPEPAFGILKEQQGARRFLLRGLANVRAEAILLATAFNLRSLHSWWKEWSAERQRTLICSVRAANHLCHPAMNWLSDVSLGESAATISAVAS